MYLYIYEHKSDIHAWKIYHIIENIDRVKYLFVMLHLGLSKFNKYSLTYCKISKPSNIDHIINVLLLLGGDNTQNSK